MSKSILGTDPALFCKWRLLDTDPETGQELWLREDDGELTFKSVTPVGALLEANKAAYNDSEGKRFGDGKVVASIDLPTYYAKIVPAKQNGDDAWIKRWLNDPDNRAYRTFKGKI